MPEKLARSVVVTPCCRHHSLTERPLLRHSWICAAHSCSSARCFNSALVILTSHNTTVAERCVNCTPSRRQRKNIKFFRPAAIRCWPLFMQRDRVRAFPSGSTRPDYAAPVWCCNNGYRSQSSAQAPACR